MWFFTWLLNLLRQRGSGDARRLRADEEDEIEDELEDDAEDEEAPEGA